MLEHLVKRITKTIGGTDTAVLSTIGSLGLQTGVFQCEYHDQMVLLLISTTLDILDNLLEGYEVSVTAVSWQLRGQAKVASKKEIQNLRLASHPDSSWNQVVQVTPSRIQLRPGNGWEFEETIDFDSKGAKNE